MDLIVQGVALRRIRAATPAAGDGIHGEPFAKHRLHELPVRVVIAEGPVDEDERRAAAVGIV